MSMNDEAISQPEDRFEDLVSVPEHMRSLSPASHAVNGKSDRADLIAVTRYVLELWLVCRSANVSVLAAPVTDCLQRSPLITSPSPRSSAGSDGESLILNTVVPTDAKERIMAASASQQHPRDSRMWCQRPATTGTTTTAVSLCVANVPNACRAASIPRRERRRYTQFDRKQLHGTAPVMGHVIAHEDHPECGLVVVVESFCYARRS